MSTAPAGRKIIYITHDLGFFLSHRLPIALRAAAAGYDVAVAGPEDRFALRLKEEGVRHIPFEISRGATHPFEQIRSVLNLYWLLRDEQPHLVHLIASKPVIFGGLLTRLMGIPSVAAVSGLGHLFIDKRLRARVARVALVFGYRAAIHHAGCHVIFQNKTDKAVLEGRGRSLERAILLPGSGTDVEQFDPSQSTNSVPVVLLPARMLWTKGVREFCDAATILRGRGVTARFRMIGDPYLGNPASISPEALGELTADGAVCWRPHTDAIASEMYDADIIALPSYGEGFPKTLIDAAAAGRAVVTSDLPGCRDAIIPGKTGLLVRPRDAVDLADKLETLVLNAGERKRMGEAGRALAERRFRIGSIVEAHLRLYERILVNRSVTSQHG